MKDGPTRRVMRAFGLFLQFGWVGALMSYALGQEQGQLVKVSSLAGEIQVEELDSSMNWGVYWTIGYVALALAGLLLLAISANSKQKKMEDK